MARIARPSVFIKYMIRQLQKGWCKGPFAVDKSGQSVDPLDPNACAWCASGADRRLIGTHDVKDGAVKGAWNFIDKVSFKRNVEIITVDGTPTTKRQLFGALEAARKLALKEGQ